MLSGADTREKPNETRNSGCCGGAADHGSQNGDSMSDSPGVGACSLSQQRYAGDAGTMFEPKRHSHDRPRSRWIRRVPPNQRGLGDLIAVNFNPTSRAAASARSRTAMMFRGYVNDMSPAAGSRRVQLVESVFEYGSRLRRLAVCSDVSATFRFRSRVLAVARGFEQNTEWRRAGVARGSRDRQPGYRWIDSGDSWRRRRARAHVQPPRSKY